MTTAVNDAIDVYLAVGGETQFSYTFPIITVIAPALHPISVETRLAGVLTTLTEGVDFTVTGAGEPLGGTILLDVGVFPAGAIAGVTWTIERANPVNRVTDFQIAGDFFAVEVNTQLDYITQILQDQTRDIAANFANSLHIDPSSLFTLGVVDDPIASAFLRAKAGGGFEWALFTPTGGALSVVETDTDITKDKLTSNNVSRRSLVKSAVYIIYIDGANYRAESSVESLLADFVNTDFVDLMNSVYGVITQANSKIIVREGIYTMTQTLTIPAGDNQVFISEGAEFQYTPTSGDAFILKGGIGARYYFGKVNAINGTTGSCIRCFNDVAVSFLSSILSAQSLEGGGAHVGKGLFVDTSVEGISTNKFMLTDVFGFDEGIRMGTNGDTNGDTNHFWISWVRDCNINIVENDQHNAGEWNVNTDAFIDNAIAIKTGGKDGRWNIIMGAQAPDPTTAKLLVIDSGAVDNYFYIHPDIHSFAGATWEDNSLNSSNIVTGAAIRTGTPNLVINGDFRVDQKGAATGVGAVNGYFGPDLWGYKQGNTPSGRFSVDVVTVGGRQWLEYEVTTADAAPAAADLYSVVQLVEADNVTHLNAGAAPSRRVTLSFRHRHVRAGTYCVGIWNSANDRIYVMEYTQSVADTDEYISHSLQMDQAGTWVTTGNGVGLKIVFIMAVGSGNDNAVAETFANVQPATPNQINGIQATSDRFRLRDLKLELGTVASEFEHEDIGLTLRKCQRYYWKSFPQGTAPAQNAGNTGALTRRVSLAGVATQGLDLTLPVPMRAAPSSTFYNPGAANALWRNVTDVGDSGAGAIVSNNDRGTFVQHTQVGTDGASEECAIHLALDAQIAIT